MNEKTLYKLDSKGKVRIWEIKVKKSPSGYVIQTQYGQKDGNLINGPDTEITAGKAKRTLEEQAILQFNSMVKKQMDKGYCEDLKAEQSPYILPQLAYDYKKLNNWETAINAKVWLVSKKLDGLRMLIRKIGTEIVAYSRKGQVYPLAAKHITKELVEFFDKYPNIILDGELYEHGMHLKDISGIGRIKLQKKWDEKGKKLTFNCFDFIDLNKPESTNLERWLFLQYWYSKGILPTSEAFSLVSQTCIYSDDKGTALEKIQKFHDEAVAEGYEGAMIKESQAPYQIDKRSFTILKFKQFTDSEFKITGVTPGNKRPEDFVVICETEEGKTFEAQPTGTVEERLKLLQELPTLIGKMATIKYFNLTPDGIPFLPKFKCVRDE